jgi:hypothetical protein
VWALSGTLLLGGGIAVQQAWAPCWPINTAARDARAYQQHDCLGWSNSSTSTFAGMLHHYAITLPDGATGLRYYSDDDSPNGPDTLFLRFTAPAASRDRFLAALGASSTQATAYAATAQWSSLWQEFDVDWDFSLDTTSRAYQFGPQQGPQPDGTVVVDDRPDNPTLYVIASVM